jgi:Flp pilus assembly protein TadG
MGMRKTLTRVRGERGAALIEAAVTLPLLLFISLGIFEFGRAFQYWQVLTNSAREGARVAVLAGIDDAAVQDRVEAYMEAGGLPAPAAPAAVDIEIDRSATIQIGPGRTASASTVTVTSPFRFIALQPVARLVVAGSDVGAPITMTASTTMRNE